MVTTWERDQQQRVVRDIVTVIPANQRITDYSFLRRYLLPLTLMQTLIFQIDEILIKTNGETGYSEDGGHSVSPLQPTHLLH